MEIKRRQRGAKNSLSPQYFYWASKPNCRKNRCSERGSWIVSGLEHSKKSSVKNIPSLNNCPYSNSDLKHNQTQIPLAKTCMKRGVAKVKRYRLIADSEAVRDEINRDNPVVIAVSLSPNFYGRKSFVNLKGAEQRGRTDSHAAGHAVTVIGYVENPESIRGLEGKYCYIVANSWGEGWGQGGHSCLSEKWLQKFVVKKPICSH